MAIRRFETCVIASIRINVGLKPLKCDDGKECCGYLEMSQFTCDILKSLRRKGKDREI